MRGEPEDAGTIASTLWNLKRLPTKVQKDVEYFKKHVRFHRLASSRKAHGSASTSR